MLTYLRRAMRGSFVVVSFLVCSIATASAATDKKETTKQTWVVDASHGTFSDTIPIEVPAFRGITPRLALSYDSSDANGLVGVGWTLAGVSQIARASPGKGAPRYDGTDIFLLDGRELIACAPGSASPSCTTGGTHSTKIESYTRIAYTGVGSKSRWTITAKDGTTSVYAPVFSVNSGADVYKWGLEQVIDTKSNVVTYHWAANQFGCCWEYPDSVTYNGTTVTFYYEARPDHELDAVGAGGMRTVHGRIKTIDVLVSGSRLRAYRLSYTTSSATSRSLLSSVQQFGKDANLNSTGTVTGGTSLPATAIGYQAGAPAFALGSHDASMSNSSNAHFFAIDINGDGRSDMLELYPSLGAMRRRTWISTGTGFVNVSDQSGMSGNSNARFLPMDVNGDGKTDIVELYPNLLWWGRRTWISTGTGFSNAGTDSTSIDYNTSSHFIAMDINGDGKSDMLELYPRLGSYRRTSWISNGTGFSMASDDSGIDYNTDSRFFAMDVNGDGKTDLLELFPSIGTWGRHIWLSNGTGFSSGALDYSMGHSADSQFLPMDVNGDGKTDLLELAPLLGTYFRKTWLSTGYAFMLASNDAGIPFSSSNWFLAMDVNGDGKSDLVEMDPSGIFYYRQIWLSVGSGFVAGASDLHVGFNTSTQIMAADVDGDGLSEMVELYPATLAKGRRVWSMAGTYPDLLASLKGSLGATTTVSYRPSSAWDNTNNPPLVQTATAVTVDDGRGGVATTYYEYAGGLHDRLEKRFLGFRYHKETQPCITGESACPYFETWFRQDYGAASKPERIDRRTGSGELLRSNIYEYKTNGATVPWTSLQTGEWDYTFINAGAACPGAECKRKYTSRTFDAYGEVTLQIDYGDYDVTGDEHTTSIKFVPHTSAYIVDKPADVKTFDGVGTAGALLTDTVTYYDGATSWSQAPSAGLPTKTARWLSSPSSFVATMEEYDAWGNVTAEVNAVGARTEFIFDPTYHLFPTSKTNALGQATTTTWDVVCGVPTQTTDLNGQSTTMTYDPLCRMSVKLEPGGYLERHTWVNLGIPGEQYELIERPAADGTTNPLWTRIYFDGPLRSWPTGATGSEATTDDTGYGARDAGARNPVCGAPTQTNDGEGQPTTMPYDPLCRPSQMTTPDDQFGRHMLDRSVAGGMTDPMGPRRELDAQQRTWRTVNKGPDAATGDIYVDTTYNARDKVASLTAPYYWVSGAAKPTTYVTKIDYDTLNRKTRVTFPDGSYQTWSYGLWSVTETDALGRPKTDSHNADDKRIAHQEFVGGAVKTTTYVYDARGHLARSIDPLGNTITYSTDSLGRTTQMVDPDWGSWILEFDGADRLTAQTDAKGQRTTFTYDALDRKTSKTSNAGTGSASTVSWTYDEVRAGSYNIGKLTTMTDGAGGKTFDHDVAGRVVKTVRTIAGTSYTFQHGFDKGGRALWTTYPDGDTLGTPSSPLEYDSAGRLRSIPGYVTSALYRADGQLTQIDNANGTVTTRQYAPERGWLTAISTTASGTAIQSVAYTRNAKGLITKVASPFANEGWTYAYDELDRLITATNATSSTYDQTLAYDTIGNITRNSRLGSYTYGTSRPHAVTAAGSNTYSYDAAGLMTSGAGRTLIWNGDNRLDSVIGSGLTMTFTYDADGDRIQQVEGAITRRYLGDDYEIEVGGSTTKYVSVAGALIARVNGTTPHWVHTDHAGSIQAETDASGIEVHRKKYRPFGEILSTGGTLDDEPRGYIGQRHDASGLLFLHARYYDPVLGRFISPDLIIDGPDTVGLNRYAYAGNDPINRKDVDGQDDQNAEKKDRKEDAAESGAKTGTKQAWNIIRGAVKEVAPKAAKFIPGGGVVVSVTIGIYHGIKEEQAYTRMYREHDYEPGMANRIGYGTLSGVGKALDELTLGIPRRIWNWSCGESCQHDE